MKQHACRFVFAGLLTPLVILLHETAHHVVATAHRIDAHFHFDRISIPSEQFISPVSFLLIVGAGPCVDLAFTVGGFVWLRRMRRPRLEDFATPTDWIATMFALSVTRWLRCFSGTPSAPIPMDEAMISELFRLPKWFLPYFIAPFAIAVVIAVIRLHPRGSRFLPFTPVFAGIAAGRFLWIHLVGPRLLP